jgi:NADH-quinone oxidoreductase subunit L
MQIETLVWLIPVPPLASFFLIWILSNRSKALSHTIAILATLTSWILSMIVLFSGLALGPGFGRQVFEVSIPWLPTGDTILRMGVLVDPLTAAMLIFVPLAILLIFIYSVGYHNFGKPLDSHDASQPGTPAHHGVEPMYSRFFAFLSLFAFGMLLLVVADNLLLMFMGWEVMGLCSYLLIGFWYSRQYENPKQITPRQAAVKAFITTRVGDVVMMLGIVYLYFASTTDKAREILGPAAGTLSFRALLYNEEFLKYLASEQSLVVGLSIAGLAGLLLLVGTVGKSAQFPLHVWLPDAMEGPTPVSAMIHAAAMVSAGVYAMIRMFPLLSAGWQEGGPLTPPMLVLGSIGAFTALFAATIAFTQNDVKKVLAYSTISQLGFMLAALGIGGYVAAIFHLVTHAFFKALLFLGSGSIIHGVEHGMHHSHEHIDPQDMRNMGGLRRKMPVTFWTFVIGGMALAGFPFITAGFWSKDEILLDGWLHAQPVFWMLALAALMTAFYTTRQILMTFFGEPRTESAAHAQESAWTMTTPLVILSFFALFAGWINIPGEFPVLGAIASLITVGPQTTLDSWFTKMVGGALIEAPQAGHFEIVPLLTSLTVALGGILIGWLVYGKAYKKADDRDPMMFLGPIYTFLQNKYYIDELYEAVFVKTSQWVSAVLTYQWIDKGIIDGSLHTIARLAYFIGHIFKDDIEKYAIDEPPIRLANATQWLGKSFRVIQTGRIQNYLIVGVLSALLFGLVYYLQIAGVIR